MYYLGIDVGKSGAYAILKDHDIQTYGKFNEKEFLNACYWLSKQQEKTICAIEKAAARHGQGVTSMFTFGENFGWLKGVLDASEISYQEIKPQVWKKEFGLNSDKENSIIVARRLFPDANLIPEHCRKEDHNIAEALLLACYAQRRL